MVSYALRPVAKRTAAGGVSLFALFGLVEYWNYLLTSRSLAAVAVPTTATFTFAVSAMLVGVAVAGFGIGTETFGSHRSTYLPVVRVCGAVGLVGLAGFVVAIVALGL